MALHYKAWNGTKILILGNTPTLPMQIEQNLSGASPANEIRFESFENYYEAYEECKKNSQYGLIILLENQGSLPILGCFNNLAKFYEEKKGPCFGILLYENEESVNGHSIVRFSKGKILDYLPARNLLNLDKAAHVLNEVWLKYIDAFENYIAPERLIHSIYEIIKSEISDSERVFLDRTITLLSQKLNLSWWEVLGLRWNHIMLSLKKCDPLLWATLIELKKLCKLENLDSQVGNINELTNLSTSLYERACSFILQLKKAYRADKVFDFLKSIEISARPGSPGLIKQIHKNSKEIIQFYNESKNIHLLKVAS